MFEKGWCANEVQLQEKLPHFVALEKSEADVEEDGEEERPPGQNICWSLDKEK